jgi:hypothetical protein
MQAVILPQQLLKWDKKPNLKRAVRTPSRLLVLLVLRLLVAAQAEPGRESDEVRRRPRVLPFLAPCVTVMLSIVRWAG